MNYYKHHIGDYDQATRHLSFVEDAAYSRLIRKYYAEERPLPKDLKKIVRLIGARTKEEKEAVETVLEEFFTLEDDGWHQKRCDEDLEAARAKAEKNREIGKRGGRPKKVETQTEPTENPDGFPEETQTVSENNPSHKPLANSHKPLEAAHREFEVGGPGESSDALPEFQSTLTPEQKASVPVVKALRAAGVPIMAANPLVGEWVGKGLTEDRVPEIVEFLRARGKTGTIHPNYLNTVIDDALNPPAPKPVKPRADDWFRSPKGIERKASEIGIYARPGETHDTLRERCESELRRRAQGVAA